MDKLPNEILELILKRITVIERFRVSMLSKGLYEKIRHIPLDIAYNINPMDGAQSIGSFFYSSVIKVNVIVDQDSIDYDSLKNMLSTFYCLKLITIKGEVTPKVVRRLIATFPLAPSFIKLKVRCDSAREAMRDQVQSITRRPIEVVDNLKLRQYRVKFGSLNHVLKYIFLIIVRKGLMPQSQHHHHLKKHFVP